MQNGEVVALSDGKRYRVRYGGVASAERNIKKHPLAGIAVGKSDTTLTIESADGSYIPEGEFDLYLDGDSGSRRIQRLGGEWTLLAPA